MNREIVINKIFTSLVDSCETPLVADLSRYNEREKNLIAFFPQVRKRMIKTSDFYSRLSSNFKQSDEILPTGCKFYKKIGTSYKVVVIEEPPRIRTIFVDTGIESILEKLRMTGKLKEYGYEKYKPPIVNKAYAFQLSFPYVVFIITLDNNNYFRRLRPFFRLHPITSLNDYLFKAPLYNIPNDQNMCIGNVEGGSTLVEAVENIIEKFWTNVYNHDYSNNIVEYQNTDQYQIHDYLSWMYFSQMDPMFIYNIKWLPYSKNIGRTINSMTHDAHNNTNESGMFKALFDTAFETSSIMIEKEPRERNVSLSMLVKGEAISIGDELLFNDEKMYLYSIVGNDEDITSIELEYPDGTIISVPVDDFENGFKTIYNPDFLETATINDIVIKPKDIIQLSIDGLKMYKRIKNIRQAPDGKIEALIGSDHYLMNNIDFSVIHIDNININGKQLNEGDIVLVMTKADTYGPVFKTSKLIYNELTVNNQGEIVLKFEDSKGYTTNINYNNIKKGTSDYNFIEEKDLETPVIAHYFDRMVMAYPKTFDRSEIIFRLMKGVGIVPVNTSIRNFMVESGRCSMLEICKKSLFDDGTRLFMKGIYHDIDFKVGDPIVYANWENPDDMLSVAGIKEFRIVDNMLYVIALTVSGSRELEIPMINASHGRVNIGAIRKVFSKCGDWSVGDKIKANETGIYNFPKKDVNSIIAFMNIPNAKYPVALCSNLCTLWMNEQNISSFTKVSPSEARWKKLEITPYDVTKIKWQHGDFFKRKLPAGQKDVLAESVQFVTKRHGTQSAFDYSYTTNWGHIEHGSMISKNNLIDRKIRHGILMPRFPITNRNASEIIRGYPNMLGGYVINTEARIIFMSDQLVEGF